MQRDAPERPRGSALLERSRPREPVGEPSLLPAQVGERPPVVLVSGDEARVEDGAE